MSYEGGSDTVGSDPDGQHSIAGRLSRAWKLRNRLRVSPAK